jgi:hypothetical protein
MPLVAEEGIKVLQLITTRYNQREWRKKIEKTLSLPPSGLLDEKQRKLFLFLKIGLQAYKSRRADPPSWIVGGYATKEVIDRAKFNPAVVSPEFTKDDVACFGEDPGSGVDEGWWEEMLVNWFVDPAEEAAADLAESESESEQLEAESTETKST